MGFLIGWAVYSPSSKFNYHFLSMNVETVVPEGRRLFCTHTRVTHVLVLDEIAPVVEVVEF